jgi:hypothetical protein
MLHRKASARDLAALGKKAYQLPLRFGGSGFQKSLPAHE